MVAKYTRSESLRVGSTNPSPIKGTSTTPKDVISGLILAAEESPLTSPPPSPVGDGAKFLL